MEVLAVALKSMLEQLLDSRDSLSNDELKKIEKQYIDIRKKMQTEETRMSIEYWKVYRGAVTKMDVNNGEIEKFLKNYRTNFKGEKSEEDEKLLSVLSSVDKLSDMSKYTLNMIKEDFEDTDDEYFQELCQKIEEFL